MIDATMKVRDVALIPDATRILEKLRIDYCCGGEQAVGEACEAAGIELEVLQQGLTEVQPSGEQSDASTDFRKLSLTELTEHIIDKHHVFTTNEMERLEALTAKVIAAHGAHHPELYEVATLMDVLFADLRPHMFKEEQILFPYVFELEKAASLKRRESFPPFGSVNNPVRMMMIEDDNAGLLLKELRRVTFDYSIPGDACMSYQVLYQSIEAFERDLHQHIHLENNILFPKAIQLESGMHA